MLCLPPHCTHRLQPLDVSFFGPLSTYYNQEVEMWLKTHPGRTVTLGKVAKLFSNAYFKSATALNALNGSKASGICPFNPDIFPDHLYLPAATTDCPEPVGENEPNVDSSARVNMSQTSKIKTKLPSMIFLLHNQIHLHQIWIEFQRSL